MVPSHYTIRRMVAVNRKLDAVCAELRGLANTELNCYHSSVAIDLFTIADNVERAYDELVVLPMKYAESPNFLPKPKSSVSLKRVNH